MMNKSDFFYELPEELIAQQPVYPRDSSRLLVFDKKTGQIEDKHFYEITDFLDSNDLLVVNNTKVLPARIYGENIETGGKIEFLLSKRLSLTDWEVLTKPAKKAKTGSKFVFSDKLSAEIIERKEEGLRVARFNFDGNFETILYEVGEMPLPHYIKSKLTDKDRYQTVYAKQPGSCAAPTAGLHFTPELLGKIKQKGVEIVEVMLHVGLGTFLPVKADDITKHKMHSEYYEISEEAAQKINEAIKDNKRIIAVGTTSVRILESVADSFGFVKPVKNNTEIFIYPPYKFKVVKALITNFHLPESTLIMLVSALIGREETLKVYKHAVDNKYRFYSFGDATFLK